MILYESFFLNYILIMSAIKNT